MTNAFSSDAEVSIPVLEAIEPRILLSGDGTLPRLFGIGIEGGGSYPENEGILYDIDPVTALASNPRHTGVQRPVGITYGPDGQLYTLGIYLQSLSPERRTSLYTLDTETGEATVVVELPDNYHWSMTDLDFDPTTGILYAMAGLPSSSQLSLLTIDIVTGDIENKGSPGSQIVGGYVGFAFDPDGNLYCLTTHYAFIGDDGVPGPWAQNLYELDKNTGQIIGQISAPAPPGIDGQGTIDLAPDGLTFYCANGWSGQDPSIGRGLDSSLFTIDPSGDVDRVGSTGIAPPLVRGGVTGLAFEWHPRIEGTVWNDADADGEQDTSEDGLAGRKVYVDVNDSGTWNSGEPDGVTDSDGEYVIYDVLPGDYTVRQVVPADWAQTYPAGGDGHAIHVETYDIIQDVDFGSEYMRATIRGTVWHDADGQDDMDPEEIGLIGWRVYVDLDEDGRWDPGEPKGVTDIDGNYVIESVLPGNGRVVTQDTPEGWELTHPGAPGTYARDLDPGQELNGRVFGNQPLAGTIRGRKWHDLNGDGTWGPGEFGLEGWTIYIDANKNGTRDGGELFDVTGTAGTYEITGVPAGVWIVAEEQLSADWVQTFPMSSGALLFSEDDTPNGLHVLDPVTGRGSGVGINGQTGVTGNTVGLAASADMERLYGSQPGALLHIQTDGGGFTALSGVTMEGMAYDPGSDVLYAAANGSFFTVSTVNGYPTAMLPSPGADIEALAYANGMVYGLAGDLSGDLHAYNVGAAQWSLVGSTGRAWYQPGLAYDPTAGMLYAKESKDTLVRTIDPATAATSVAGDTEIDRGGGLTYVSTPAGTHLVVIGPGEVRDGIEFGNDYIGLPSQVSGRKWEDLNGDGIWQQGAEPALAGWRIYLDLNDNGRFDLADEPSSIADVDGLYSLTAPNPGACVIAEVTQPGYRQTYPGPGGFGLLAIDVNGILYDIAKVTGEAGNERYTGVGFPVGITATPDGTIYVLSSTVGGPSPNSLYEVDPRTGGSELIGVTGIPAIAEGDLAYDPLSGMLYGLMARSPSIWPPVSQGLFSIDPSTGVATAAGTLSVSQMSAMAFNGSGDLFILDGRGQALLTVDKLDGDILDEVSISGSLEGPAGMIVDPVSGWLYVTSRVGDSSYVHVLDPDTGQLAPIGPTNVGLMSGLARVGGARMGHAWSFAPGEVLSEVWFGNEAATGTISGKKWEDLNGDGVRDFGEEGLAGWRIYVDLDHDGAWDEGEPFDWTDSAGIYIITDLPGGTYVVAEEVRPGWEQTSPGYPSGLFFSVDNNPNGLYLLDTATGAATHVGASGVSDRNVGLSPSFSGDILYGSDPFTRISQLASAALV